MMGQRKPERRKQPTNKGQKQAELTVTNRETFQDEFSLKQLFYLLNTLCLRYTNYEGKQLKMGINLEILSKMTELIKNSMKWFKY